MKFKVLLALSLFLHLLVHPLLHAADARILAPEQHSSLTSSVATVPATPECAVCHIAGVAQAAPSAHSFFADSSSDFLDHATLERAISNVSPGNRSPRAPPVS